MAGFSLIKIFSDTNILHASQAHLLLAGKVAQYIAAHQRIESVELKWMLPEMVIEERRHQMLLAARELKPKIDDLEKLLGHQLGINDEILADRIDAKIKRTIDELGIEVCKLDNSSVDWGEVVSRSARRQPPFEISGEKEKGFRDAVIAQTFLQEHAKSPATPRSCLLVFVTGDKQLCEYLAEKTNDVKNVRLLETLEDLKSLLNAISSEIAEEFLQEISPMAKLIFYDFDKKDGLYIKGEVMKKINQEYSDELGSVTGGYPKSRRVEDSVLLGEQTFVKKDGQTVVWRTEVKKNFKVIQTPDLVGAFATAFASAANKTLLTSNPDDGATVLASGCSVFSVAWQHQITTAGKISRPKVIGIDFMGHEWSK